MGPLRRGDPWRPAKGLLLEQASKTVVGSYGVAHGVEVPAVAVIAPARAAEQYLPWRAIVHHQHRGIEGLHVRPERWKERTVTAEDAGTVPVLDGEVFEDEAGPDHTSEEGLGR